MRSSARPSVVNDCANCGRCICPAYFDVSSEVARRSAQQSLPSRCDHPQAHHDFDPKDPLNNFYSTSSMRRNATAACA
jgi:hypothetical protein